MALTEAIILAGGLGTRLRAAVPNLPKCMAPVNREPFLKYIIEYLQQSGIERFIFSLGYKPESIIDYLEKSFPTLNYKVALENEPLGTGGAIRLAIKLASDENVLVTNGDTLFKINVQTLAAFHTLKNADCTLCLKPMKDFDRYGVVETDRNQKITSFKEKQLYKEGLINGGIYALNSTAFLKESMGEKFSFEKDYLEAYYRDRQMFAIPQDEYFIDIGIPEDFERAQLELR